MKSCRMPAALAALSLILLGWGRGASAQDTALPPAEDIVRNVNAVDQGESLTRTLTITMTDKHGKERRQVTQTFRKYFGDEKRSAIFYLEPANVEDTAFLTYDYASAEEADDQWLYLPSLRRLRRISSANRGDYYLGTDFTYEDMKQDTRLSLGDYDWTTVGTEDVAGLACYVIEGIPKSDAIMDELGYSKFTAYIDREHWLQRKSDTRDINGNALKTVLWQWEQMGAYWAAVSMTATNHKTEHRTVFEFSDIDFETDIPDDRFNERSIKRGVR